MSLRKACAGQVIAYQMLNTGHFIPYLLPAQAHRYVYCILCAMIREIMSFVLVNTWAQSCCPVCPHRSHAAETVQSVRCLQLQTHKIDAGDFRTSRNFPPIIAHTGRVSGVYDAPYRDQRLGGRFYDLARQNLKGLCGQQASWLKAWELRQELVL